MKAQKSESYYPPVMLINHIGMTLDALQTSFSKIAVLPPFNNVYAQLI
jgi:hypothetical protein